MNKPILFILVMCLLAFGTLAVMATASSGQATGASGAKTQTIVLNQANAANPAAPAPAAASVQVVSVRAVNSGGYDHPSLQVKAGIPVEFHFSADSNVGCGRQLILDGLGVNLVSQNGEDQVARFTPTAPGTYAYHCGMNMFRGSLQVV